MRSTSTPSRWDYTYGVYLYYNIGYDAKARVLEWADWALGQRMAYKPDRRVEIYTKDGSIDLSSSGTRSIPGRMATLDADNRTSKADNFTILNYDDPGAFRMLADSDDSDDQDTPALSDAKTHAVCPDGGAPALRLPEMRCKYSYTRLRAVTNLIISQLWCLPSYSSGEPRPQQPGEQNNTTGPLRRI